MILKTCHPEKSLQHLIKEYYYISIQNDSVKSLPIIDDCCYDFVFFKELDGNFFFGPHADVIPLKEKVFTIHGLKPPYKITIKNTLTFFGIKVHPWVNSYFFSQAETQGVVDLAHFDLSLLELHGSLLKEQPWAIKFSYADHYFMNRNIQLTPTMEIAKALCSHIYDRQGILTVNDLSVIFNKSRQYLSRVFKKEVMYGLKQFIITVRILALINYKVKNTDKSLTQLSYEYGYFDQSHFIHDFKNVCGVTPQIFFNNVPEFILRH